MKVNVDRKKNLIEMGEVETAKAVLEVKVYTSFDGYDQAGAATLRVAMCDPVDADMLLDLDKLALANAANIVEKINGMAK